MMMKQNCSLLRVLCLMLAALLLCGTALAMLIWKRKQENSTEEIDEENMEVRE